MQFLNPLVLFGLIAAGIPILLHLLNLRRSRVIEFSTLAFLKELQRSKIRRLKIKQWLLLLLRTLVITFIVLAFARPALRGDFSFLPGTSAKSSVVIIIDDSFSMMTSDDEGQLLKQAKQKANAVLDMLDPGDEAVLIRTSGNRIAEKEFTAALNAVRTEVEAVEASFVHSDYRDVMTGAAVILEKSQNLNKEIYLITDEQRTHFLSENEGSDLFGDNVRLLVFPLGTNEVANAALTDVEVLNALFERNKPVDLKTTIVNNGPSAMNGAIASVFLNGERVMQKTVDIDAGGTEIVEVSVTPKESGFVEGFVELENDKLPEDNRRYFSFYIPEQINVLVGPSGTQEAKIVQLALRPRAETETAINIDAVNAGALRSANFSRYDAVILTSAEAIANESFTTRLRAYVENGGGVIVFPDGSGSTEAFSQQLLPGLGIPQPGGMNGSVANRDAFTTFGKIDFDHPLFRNVFDEARAQDEEPNVESPSLFANIKLRPGTDALPVIATSGGDAFLIDHREGKGKVLVYGAAPNLTWSDFPLKGIFVPLMNRSVMYMASTESRSTSGTAGNTFELLLPEAIAASGPVDLIAPDGVNTRLTPKQLTGGNVYTIESPAQPGIYEIRDGERTLWKVPVNIDPAESNLEEISSDEREEFFASLGTEQVSILDREANIEQTLAEIRYGVELWKYLIVFALICALAEMLIARDTKRQMAEVAQPAV